MRIGRGIGNVWTVDWHQCQEKRQEGREGRREGAREGGSEGGRERGMDGSEEWMGRQKDRRNIINKERLVR